MIVVQSRWLKWLDILWQLVRLGLTMKPISRLRLPLYRNPYVPTCHYLDIVSDVVNISTLPLDEKARILFVALLF
jgi:hypothetical protein